MPGCDGPGGRESPGPPRNGRIRAPGCPVVDTAGHGHHQARAHEGSRLRGLPGRPRAIGPRPPKRPQRDREMNTSSHDAGQPARNPRASGRADPRRGAAPRPGRGWRPRGRCCCCAPSTRARPPSPPSGGAAPRSPADRSGRSVARRRCWSPSGRGLAQRPLRRRPRPAGRRTTNRSAAVSSTPGREVRPRRTAAARGAALVSNGVVAGAPTCSPSSSPSCTTAADATVLSWVGWAVTFALLTFFSYGGWGEADGSAPLTAFVLLCRAGDRRALPELAARPRRRQPGRHQAPPPARRAAHRRDPSPGDLASWTGRSSGAGHRRSSGRPGTGAGDRPRRPVGDR